jgi:hypothetical protein
MKRVAVGEMYVVLGIFMLIIWSWAPDGNPTPRQTGRLIVGRNLISTSTSTWVV